MQAHKGKQTNFIEQNIKSLGQSQNLKACLDLPSKPMPTQNKKDYTRLTFTQGVQELIKNFDKKFIVRSIAMAQ